MFFLAARFGRLADRDGPRRYLLVAPLVMAVGMVLLTLVTETNPLVPLPGVVVLAFGLAMMVAPITSAALKAAPDQFAGLAAGVNTTVSRLGGLIATPLDRGCDHARVRGELAPPQRRPVCDPRRSFRRNATPP